MTEIQKLNVYCYGLIKVCRETNVEKMMLVQTDVIHKGEEIGSWEIEVRKINFVQSGERKV